MFRLPKHSPFPWFNANCASQPPVFFAVWPIGTHWKWLTKNALPENSQGKYPTAEHGKISHKNAINCLKHYSTELYVCLPWHLLDSILTGVCFLCKQCCEVLAYHCAFEDMASTVVLYSPSKSPKLTCSFRLKNKTKKALCSEDGSSKMLWV